MPKYSSKIGDIYLVKLDENTKKYFQYIINDMTCLNSSVIRIFKKVYSMYENPSLSDIIRDEIDFYVHTVIKWGEDKKLWEKVGNITEIGKTDILFRSTLDSIRQQDGSIKKISKNWRIWKINEPMIPVGKLEGENRKAEIGGVMPAYQVIGRMRTGKYNITYPGYDENSALTYVPDEEGEKNRKELERIASRNKREYDLRKIVNRIIKKQHIENEQEHKDASELLEIYKELKKKSKVRMLEKLMNEYTSNK